MACPAIGPDSRRPTLLGTAHGVWLSTARPLAKRSAASRLDCGCVWPIKYTDSPILARLLRHSASATPADPRQSAAQVLGFWPWPGYSCAAGSATPVVSLPSAQLLRRQSGTATLAPGHSFRSPCLFGVRLLPRSASLWVRHSGLQRSAFPALGRSGAGLFQRSPTQALSRSSALPLKCSAAPPRKLSRI